MGLERKSGWVVKREHENLLPPGLAWSLPILPSEVCWQTNKSCQGRRVPCRSHLLPTSLSPPRRQRRRDFTAESCAFPSPRQVHKRHYRQPGRRDQCPPCCGHRPHTLMPLEVPGYSDSDAQTPLEGRSSCRGDASRGVRGLPAPSPAHHLHLSWARSPRFRPSSPSLSRGRRPPRTVAAPALSVGDTRSREHSPCAPHSPFTGTQRQLRTSSVYTQGLLTGRTPLPTAGRSKARGWACPCPLLGDAPTFQPQTPLSSLQLGTPSPPLQVTAREDGNANYRTVAIISPRVHTSRLHIVCLESVPLSPT